MTDTLARRLSDIDDLVAQGVITPGDAEGYRQKVRAHPAQPDSTDCVRHSD